MNDNPNQLLAPCEMPSWLRNVASVLDVHGEKDMAIVGRFVAGRVEEMILTLREYAKRENWKPTTHRDVHDGWMPDGDGWEPAEEALRGQE